MPSTLVVKYSTKQKQLNVVLVVLAFFYFHFRDMYLRFNNLVQSASNRVDPYAQTRCYGLGMLLQLFH